MRKHLKKKLSDAMSPDTLSKVCNSFDIVGDLAIIKVPKNCSDAEAVAQQILTIHKGIKTVLAQTTPVKGDHRIRGLTLLAGKDQTVTRYKEHGCTFEVDIAKCYFSPRLKNERLRIASQVSPNETVVNMFAGVGCFSVIIAKRGLGTQVYSIDINPVAYQCMVENIRINRLFSRVHPMLGDSKELVETKLQGIADRVLMPLPEKALEYLPTALSALKNTGGWIHYYDFQHSAPKEDPTKLTKQKVAEKLDSLGIKYIFTCSHVIRSTGPNWYQIVLDIHVAPASSKS